MYTEVAIKIQQKVKVSSPLKFFLIVRPYAEGDRFFSVGWREAGGQMKMSVHPVCRLEIKVSL